ncbi:MAG: 2-dehydro-3-deoxygalactonokinase [Betaproteobacteria bacterium]|nr:2-dehydro-3-deoxygalactonokinase [Betaproteobacteria bacterium]
MLAIDWGTTSFRAYRLDPAGRIVNTRSAPAGILSVEGGNFAAALEQQAGDWIADGETQVVMSGMIGSRQGWIEVPYAACPAGLDEIAAGMRKVAWDRGEAWIAPGLTCRDDAGVPDVIRGEETQILGILAQFGAGRHTICLPGTHSKWVEVENGKIVHFSTHMTGEAFAVFKAHSILGRMMKDGVTDRNAFTDGVRRSADDGGMLHHLFGVRSRGLLGELQETASASYLSGLLIGHEIHAAGISGQPVHLLCTPQLADVYRQALDVLGLESSTLDSNAVTTGLFRLASHLKK